MPLFIIIWTSFQKQGWALNTNIIVITRLSCTLVMITRCNHPNYESLCETERARQMLRHCCKKHCRNLNIAYNLIPKGIWLRTDLLGLLPISLFPALNCFLYFWFKMKFIMRKLNSQFTEQKIDAGFRKRSVSRTWEAKGS